MILPDVRLLVLAFWLGAALGAVFILLGFLRLVLCLSKYTVFLLDVLFCLFSAVLTFLLALAGTNGQLRLYWFFFEVLGFYCVYILLSHFLQYIASCVQRFFARQRVKKSAEKGKERGKSKSFPWLFRKRQEKNEKNT